MILDIEEAIESDKYLKYIVSRVINNPLIVTSTSGLGMMVSSSGKSPYFSTTALGAVALANTKGGLILVGVEDDGEITGCENYDTQNIIEGIYDRTMPKLFCEVEEVSTDDKVILKISIQKGNNIYTTSAGEVYKRLGKNTKPMPPDEFPITESAKVNKDFSNVIIDDSSEEDIDSLEVHKIKEKLKARDPESTLPLMEDRAFLKDLYLVRQIEDKIKLTVAGMLFVGKQSAINRTIPQAEVIYLHYSDINKTEYDI